MDKDTIQSVAKRLELIDIALVRQTLSTDSDRYVLCNLSGENTRQQVSLGTGFSIVEYGDENEVPQIRTLVASISLGIRLVGTQLDEQEKSDADDEVPVVASIEAEFCAEYAIDGEQPKENELEEFVRFNSVHNVWPFWRQVVFDLARAARLPELYVPLFRGSAIGEVAGNIKKGKADEGEKPRQSKRTAERKGKSSKLSKG